MLNFTLSGGTELGATLQQHLPLRIRQLLRLVDHDVRERACEQIRLGGRQPRLVGERHLHVGPPQHGHHEHLRVVGVDQMLDDPVHLFALIGQHQFPLPPSARGQRVTEP